VWRLREAAVRARWAPRLTSVRMVFCQDTRQLSPRARLQKAAPLGKVVPHVAQTRQLFGCLNPLGYHPQAQDMRRVDHRRHYLLAFPSALAEILLSSPMDKRSIFEKSPGKRLR
jgi:hypothetical protein